jgi:phage terminase Nu1 subunit (DNA packaging protein)
VLNKTTVSRSQLAKLLNISPNRVSELRKAGIISAVSEGPLRFDPADTERRFADYKKKDATRLAQSGNREQLEARLRLHKSNLVKQRNKLNSLKEQVMTIAETEQAYNAFRGIVLTELKQLPGQITDKLGSTKDMGNAAEAIESSVHAALRSIQGNLTAYCDAESDLDGIPSSENAETSRNSISGIPLIAMENADLVAEIRTVRTERDHVVAEANEIVADLFSGKCVYAQDIERVLSDRSVSARAKLLGLSQLLARVVLGNGSGAAGHLTEAVEQIAAEIKPFDAADFRAKVVQDRASEPDDSETEEPDAEGLAVN